jgi:hypothetical protein
MDLEEDRLVQLAPRYCLWVFEDQSCAFSLFGEEQTRADSLREIRTIRMVDWDLRGESRVLMPHHFDQGKIVILQDDGDIYKGVRCQLHCGMVVED